LVHVTTLKDDWYEFRPAQQALVGRRTGNTFAVGATVTVVIKAIDYYRPHVELMLVPPVPQATSDVPTLPPES
jgi:ribonuclease R